MKFFKRSRRKFDSNLILKQYLAMNFAKKYEIVNIFQIIDSNWKGPRRKSINMAFFIYSPEISVGGPSNRWLGGIGSSWKFSLFNFLKLKYWPIRQVIPKLGFRKVQKHVELCVCATCGPLRLSNSFSKVYATVLYSTLGVSSTGPFEEKNWLDLFSALI